MPLEYAIEIEVVTGGEVTWQALVPHLAHRGKHWEAFTFTPRPVTMRPQSVALSKITPFCRLPTLTRSLYDLIEDIKRQGLKQPVCVDADYKLIFGEKRFHAHVILQKETIVAWQLSLADLIAEKYPREELHARFTLSDRIAISLAAEKFLGARQGQRSDRSRDSQLGRVRGRTDDFMARLLHLGSRQTYNQAKKIFQQGSPELMKAVDLHLLSVQAAVGLIPLPFEQQRQILSLTRPEISQTVSQLRKSQHISLQSKSVNKERV